MIIFIKSKLYRFNLDIYTRVIWWRSQKHLTCVKYKGGINIDNKNLKDILNKSKKLIPKGKVADYIPELKRVNPELLGLSLINLNGEEFMLGDYNYQFTIQSISKIIVLTSILMTNSLEKIKEKVTLEPTSDAFNSIKQLEIISTNKPLNPMINSGAIVSVSMLEGETYEEKFKNVLSLVRKLSCNENITYNDKVYQSEKVTGSRNRALAYYMQSTGIIEWDENVEKLLDTYFKVCSIEVNCTDLARIATIYANRGISPITKERYFSKEACKIVRATMALCGMYDESGEVAITGGLPSKSGVSGGILSVVPNKMGIGIFGPALNEKGTSVAGINILNMLSEEYDLSIY